MSYLVLPGGIESFNKATISLWFKVPQASLDAAGAEEDAFYAPDNPGDPPPLLGRVPLVVFGKEGKSRTSVDQHSDDQQPTTSTAVHSCVEQASAVINGNPADAGSTLVMTYWAECTDTTSERTYFKSTFSYSTVPGKPTEPSFIAVDRSGYLIINFESTQTGNATLAYDLTSATSKYYTQETVKECWTFTNLPGCGDFSDTVTSDGGLVGVMEIVFSLLGFRLITAVADNYVDEGSSPRVDHPATRTYGPSPGDMGTGSFFFTPPKNFAADTWHHVLVSVDMTGGSASVGVAVGESIGNPASHFSATSTMYLAIDDVNYPTGGGLFPGTNKVVTGNAETTAFSGQASNYVDNGDGTFTQVPEGPVPSYSLNNMSVPAAEIGIPATEKYTDKVRHVEMAEFQMWLGRTINTSDTRIRRAFIDAQGKPVRPNKKVTDSDPTSGSIALLGTPTVTLHGSGNWIKGHNTGTTGTDADGKDIPGGQFKPTGKIKRYKPEPSLHGPQSPPKTGTAAGA